MSIHLFILAGGSGTRLWPLSKSKNPKQFLKFSSPYSLLQQALLRFCQIPSCYPHVLTAVEFTARVEEQLQELQIDLPLILEPTSKNTLPALCHALKTLHLAEEDCVLVLPTDHVFDEVHSIIQMIEEMQKHPLDQKILLFGAEPYYPETGYGYIIKGATQDGSLFEVAQFIEKPNYDQASDLLQSNRTLWNTGLFLFQVGHMKELLKIHAPDFFSYLHGNLEFNALPSLSIDYGLLEKTKEMVVYPVQHKWVDLGSWDRLYHYFIKDENENVLIGDIHTLSTNNSLIIGSKKKIATLGLDDLLIIDTEELLFIGKKSRAHEIKELRLLINEEAFDVVERRVEESPK